jgi:hypothetical protein
MWLGRHPFVPVLLIHIPPLFNLIATLYAPVIQNILPVLIFASRHASVLPFRLLHLLCGTLEVLEIGFTLAVGYGSGD